MNKVIVDYVSAEGEVLFMAILAVQLREDGFLCVSEEPEMKPARLIAAVEIDHIRVRAENGRLLAVTPPSPLSLGPGRLTMTFQNGEVLRIKP